MNNSLPVVDAMNVVQYTYVVKTGEFFVSVGSHIFKLTREEVESKLPKNVVKKIESAGKWVIV